MLQTVCQFTIGANILKKLTPLIGKSPLEQNYFLSFPTSLSWNLLHLKAHVVGITLIQDILLWKISHTSIENNILYYFLQACHQYPSELGPPIAWLQAGLSWAF
jgi:hypothetical protein